MTPMSKFLTACVMSLTIWGEIAAYAATLPQLPQKQVDVTMPTVTGSTLNATCATLQSQINAAAALNVNLTHEVILATGTTCTGPYKLPSHTGGTGWILMKGPNYASLPASGTRVSPSDAALMPVIKYGDDGVANTGAFSAQTGAQRYRIIGISIVQNSALVPNWSFISTGYNNANATNTGYIILDRIIIQDTDPAHESRQGIYGFAQLGHTALIDSYVAGIKDIGNDNDTQAWLSITNPGPILVRNNFLEASGENLMLGGGAPPSVDLMPKDITIQNNTFSKNSAWWGAGNSLTKTLLELKLGVRVLIEGNDFLDMPYNDGGYAHRLTARAESNTYSFVEVSDLTIRYNRYANVTNWLVAFGSDDNTLQHTMHSKRWYIHNNLVYGLGWLCGGGASCGETFAIHNGGTTCTDPTPTCKNEDITFSHNTIDNVGDGVLSTSISGQVGLDYKDNLINANGGRGARNFTTYGTAYLNADWASWTWTNNRIAGIGGGESTANYPQGTNSYPASYTNFLWTNRASRDYTLQTGSPAKGTASDGTDQGVNFTAYNAARTSKSGGGGGADLTPPATPQNVQILIN
jgi:hypothetical protein